MTRTIDVTAGDIDYLTARVTEQHGKPLTSITWEVGLGGYGDTDRPTTWRAADLVETVSDTVVLVSMLIDDTTTPAADRYLWIRPHDTPTIRGYCVQAERINVI